MVRDAWYRECVQQVAETEADFAAIRGSLTEVQQNMLDDYIAALTTLDDCLIHLAYRLGREA